MKKLNELEVIIAGRARSHPEKVRETGGVSGMDTATCIYIRNKVADYLANGSI
jgi:hypothetical protein